MKPDMGTKTRFKMYKAKHQWVIAGATFATMAVVGLTQTQLVHADTDASTTTSSTPNDATTSNTTATAQTATSVKLKNVTRTIHYVDASGTTVAPDTVQTAHFTSNDNGTTWSQTDATTGFAAVTAPTIANSTPDQATIDAATVSATDANSSLTVTYTTTADAATTTTASTTAEATQPATTSATTPAATTSTQASAKAQSRALSARSLSTSNGNATIDVNGTNSLTESYTGVSSPKADAGTNDTDTINVKATNLVKGDTLSITLPDFKKFTQIPTISGTSKSQSGNVVTYTVTTDTITLAGFTMNMAANAPTNGQLNYNGQVSVAVNGNVTSTIDLSATYQLATFGGYSFGNGVPSNTANIPAQLDDNFVRRVSVNYEGNLKVADYNQLTINIPTPKSYLLDVAATRALQQFTTGSSLVWNMSQAAAGSDIVLTLDKAASNPTAAVNSTVYFVGQLTEGSGTVKADAAATVNGSTVYGDFSGSFGPFSVTLTSGDPITSSLVNPTMYVGPTDLNTYNVMNQTLLSLTVTKTTSQNARFTFSTPNGMTTKGITINSTGAAALLGLAGTLSAYDANGNVLDTAELATMGKVNGSQYIWLPNTTDTIAKIEVAFTNLPNSSYSLTSLAPILTVSTEPTGTETINIPVSYDLNGETGIITNYNVTVTDSHVLLSANPHLDVAGGRWYLAGDTLQNYTFYPFDAWSLTTYNLIDSASVFFIPLPDHTTFVSTSNFSTNTSVITTNGHQYLRVDIPAGYAVNSSVNNKYNTNPQINGLGITVKANDDVLPSSVLAVGTATAFPSFIGIDAAQMDDDFWQKSGGRIWDLAQIRAAGFDTIADALEAAGFTKAYLDKSYRSSGLETGSAWHIYAPTILSLSTGIKGDSDSEYVSGTNDMASFYPDDQALTGTIRDYLYNGSDGAVTNYTSLITLPKAATGAAYSLNLSGAITVPAGVTVQYSTQAITGTDGQALSADQLSSFTDGSTITDWSTVQSILFTASAIAKDGNFTIVFPVTVADYTVNGATANATAFNYTTNESGLLGAVTSQLQTRVAESKRTITVVYVDAKGNTIAPSKTLTADAGSVLALNALTITGYKAQLASQNYTVSEDATQTVTFVYDQAAMNITVYYINFLTNGQIKTGNLSGFIGDTVDLSGTSYTTLDGYTPVSGNAQSYTVTTGQKQFVNLYFTPQQLNFTVQYLNAADQTQQLAPSMTLSGYSGYTYAVNPITIVGYTAQQLSYSLALTAKNTILKVLYDADPQILTVHYVDANDQRIHADTTATTSTDASYDLNGSDNDLTIAGYSRTSDATALQGTATIDSTGNLIVKELALVYAAMPQTLTIHYRDSLDNNTIVSTDTVPGFTNDQGVYTLVIPANYRVIDGATTLNYVLKANAEDNVIDVYLTHQIKHYTITTTRTIHYTGASQNPADHLQTVTWRVSQDLVDPDKTVYTAGGFYEAVTSPSISGYTVDQPIVAQQLLAPTTAAPSPSQVTVTYTANPAQLKVTYIDDVTGKTVGDIEILNGVTDGTGTYTVTVPEKYALADKQKNQIAYTFNANTNNDFVVHLTHAVSHGEATSTRTITYTVNGKATAPATHTQTALWKSATDEVTGETVYTAQAGYYQVVSPAIAGYTPDHDVIAQVALGSSLSKPESSSVTVTYTANPAQLKVTYLDDVTGQTVGAGETLTGVTDGTGTYNVIVPEKYALADKQKNQVDYTFKADTNNDFVVHLTHAVSHGEATSTRTIMYTVNGKATAPTNHTQTVLWKSATDEVTGETVYTAQAAYYQVVSPMIVGYTPDHDVIAQVALGSSLSKPESSSVTVTYTANPAQLKVTYLDDVTGQTVGAGETLTGVTDGTGTYNVIVPEKYALADKQKNQVDYTFKADTNNDFVVHLTHAVSHGEATSTRTIMYTVNGKATAPTNHTQTVLWKSATDEVTGETVYTAQAAYYQVVSPMIVGYTPDHDVIAQVALGSSLSKPESSSVTVTYTANPAQLKVTYLDDVTGQTVGAGETLTGVTDGTGTYNVIVPEKYALADKQKNQVDYTFKADTNNDFVVHLTHAVSHGEATSTRTIMYTVNGKATAPTNHTQTVLWKSATDEVTGETVYTAQAAYYQVVSPMIVGYTPDHDVIAQVALGSSLSKPADSTISVTYTANPAQLKVTYIDDVTGKTVGDIEILKGVTDGTGTYNVTVPEKYTLADKQKDQIAYTFKADTNNDFDIHLTHAVSHGEATSTRTITYTVNGKATAPATHTQTVLWKSATDEVTGETVYTAQGNYSVVATPTMAGYTPSRRQVASQVLSPTLTTPKNSTETIVYTADQQIATVDFVDQVTGQTLMTKTLSGPSDSLSDYSPNADIEKYFNQHYILINNNFPEVGMRFDTTSDATQHFTISFGHQQYIVSPGDDTQPSLTQPITRTVALHDAQGNALADNLTQVANLTRIATVDAVSGTVSYGSWQAATFSSLAVPEIPDYTSQISQIPEASAMANTSLVVIYTKKQPVHPALPDTDHPVPSQPEKVLNPTTTRATSPKVAKTSPLKPTASTQSLPHTGDNNSTWLSILGASLVGLFGLAGTKKRRHD